MQNQPLRIGLATYEDVADLDDSDIVLLDELRKRGQRAEAVVWDDPDVDWSSLDICVIRSTWDYHHRLDEFLEWAERAAGLTRLWNPIEVVRWNTHKTYLRDLAERGVPVVPTEWLAKGATVDLAGLMRKRGWHRAVVKPSVSASAHATVLVTDASLPDGQAHLDELLAERDVMVQPFMPSVETYRERSLLFIDGEFTHAVSRPPRLRTDMRAAGVEHASDFGLVAPLADEVDFARRTLRAASYDTLYARVDIVRNDEGRPLLLELELVEPALFLHLFPLAAELLAGAIAARVP